MTSARHGGLSPALVETVAGLSAGATAILVVHPLDVVKIRMQIHRSSSSARQVIGPAKPVTMSSLLRSLVRAERPVASLYRGLTPNLIGNASSWASFFFFKSRIETAIAALKSPSPSSPSPSSPSSSSSSSTSAPSSSAPARLSPADFFAASLLAGAATQALTNPIWVLKTRMLSSDRAAAGAYPSMWAGAGRLLRAEGIAGFYRGLGVGMLSVSHGAVQFAVYDPARRFCLARQRRQQQEQQQQQQPQSRTSDRSLHAPQASTDNQKMSNETTLLVSTASKLAAGAATYPLQVLRARLQNYDAEARFGRGIRGVAARLWREEGPRGFYRGLVPGIVRVLPATWVTFLVYENVRFYLPRWAGQE